MRLRLAIFTLIFFVFGAHSLIVPDEIPTILSVIYSNIPVLKKGTDSRLGWGFRLGNRADFQVLVELGPQTYTQPLANQGDGANSKRNTVNSLADILYAQRLKDKHHQKHHEHHEKHISDTEGGKWLENWSKSVHNKKEKVVAPEPRPGIAIGEIDAKSVIPEDSADLVELQEDKSEASSDPIIQLKQLYAAKNESDEATVDEAKEESESTTLKNDN